MKALGFSWARIVLVSFAVVLAGVCPAAASDSGRIALNQTLTLYPSPRQHGSYSLYYDITLTSPGLVSVGIEVLGTEPGSGEAGRVLGVSLRRERNELELRHVDFGLEGGTFSYGIDAYELEKGRGTYRIVVSNWSLKQKVDARLVVLYPGTACPAAEDVIMIPGGSF
jgi:hypothetical protein